MTRIALGAVIGLAVGLIAGAACGLHAQVTDEVQAAADDAGVDPVELAGAVATTGLDARTYLIRVGELAAPVPACGWPICGPLGQRLWCVEAIESSHGRFMWNPVGLWYGNHVEHAGGWLGFMPTTAATWGAIIGDRASEWRAAASMITAGRGSAFAGIAAGRC